MGKKSILFVDDEQNILDGLRRMLRSLRKEFKMDFAENAASALEMMDSQTCDIVVSDMRMPGMDGADFLTQIKLKFPQTIRLMLTGQADDESVMRAVGVVHQFLAKPCDPDKLKRVIIRSSALHDLLTNGEVKELVSGIDTLPSIPSLYYKLQDKLNDPDVELQEISALIEQDIAMTAKILQLVNSAFFGLYQKVETPSRAVTLLGTDTIKSLVIGLGIFSEDHNQKSSTRINGLWKHSLVVSNIAKSIAAIESDDTDVINDSFLAGMLHDIGKLILINNMEDEYSASRCLASDEGLPDIEAEQKIWGADHSEMGAYLLGLWGFHHRVVEAVGFHHRLTKYPAATFTPTHAVHIANALYYSILPDESNGLPAHLEESYLENVNLVDKTEVWKALAQQEIDKFSSEKEKN